MSDNPQWTVTRCGSCNAKIIWAWTTSGARVPVDAQPHPDGDLRIYSTANTGPTAVVVSNPAEPLFGRTAYTSHFATCPNAAQHRAAATNKTRPDAAPEGAAVTKIDIGQAVDEATRLAGLVLSNLGEPWHANLRLLPAAIRDGLVVRAALAYLLGTETLTPTRFLGVNDEWIALDIPEPYRSDFATAVQEAVERQARINAALPRR